MVQGDKINVHLKYKEAVCICLPPNKGKQENKREEYLPIENMLYRARKEKLCLLYGCTLIEECSTALGGRS
jgi:hypothetical protein